MTVPPTLDVDPEMIERDLDHLWAQMTEATSDEGRESVTRACTLNLVVFGASEREASEIGRVMAEVTTEHPGRILVILPRAGSHRKGIQVLATAQCHRDGRTDKQICCEQIVITSDGKGMERLPSLVRPLLVSDLPTYLWWRDRLDSESLLLESMAKSADGIIVDSSTSMDQNFKGLQYLIQRTAPWAAVSDLAWSVLTPWRVLLAGFFDLPEFRTCLGHISQVELVSSGAGTPHLPSQVALLAAWLSSCLGWEPIAAPIWSEEGVCEWALTKGEYPVSIVTKPQSAKTLAGPLCSIQLLTAQEPPTEFAAVAASEGNHLEGRVRRRGEVLAQRLICFPDGGESVLVAEELEYPGHDLVYERSVEFLAGIHGLQ